MDSFQKDAGSARPTIRLLVDLYREGDDRALGRSQRANRKHERPRAAVGWRRCLRGVTADIGDSLRTHPEIGRV